MTEPVPDFECPIDREADQRQREFGASDAMRLERFRKGDPQAALSAAYDALLNEKPVPAWAARPLASAIADVLNGEAVDWPAGVAMKKGKQARARATGIIGLYDPGNTFRPFWPANSDLEAQKRFWHDVQVLGWAVNEALNADPSLTVGPDLWDRMATADEFADLRKRLNGGDEDDDRRKRRKGGTGAARLQRLWESHQRDMGNVDRWQDLTFGTEYMATMRANGLPPLRRKSRRGGRRRVPIAPNGK